VVLHARKGVPNAPNPSTPPSISVDPPGALTVQKGDCLMWEVVKDDGGSESAGVHLINFFDTAAEIPSGKTPMPASNRYKLGYDFCKLDLSPCVMYIGLDKAIYGYEAQVKYGSDILKADPEIDVQCDGC